MSEQPNILDAIHASLTRFTHFTRKEDAWLLTAWIAHTYLYKELRETPRLILTASTYGSGKTTTANHVARLSYKGRRQLGSSLTAFQLRVLVDQTGTNGVNIFDEIQERFAEQGEDRRQLMGIVKNGYTDEQSEIPITTMTKNDGPKVDYLDTFAPVGLVGNGLRDVMSDEETSRCHIVTLSPSPVQITAYDRDEHAGEVAGLVQGIQRWADGVRDLARVDAQMPVNVMGRDREIWRPLKRVAILSGSHVWAERIDAMAVAYVEDQEARKEEQGETQSEHEALLSDIVRTCNETDALVLDKGGRQWLKTEQAIDAVCADYSRWLKGELTPHRFGHHMRNLGLTSGMFRDSGGRRQRGWSWRAITDLHATLTGDQGRDRARNSVPSVPSGSSEPTDGEQDGGEVEQEEQDHDVSSAPSFDSWDEDGEDLPDGTCVACDHTHPTCDVVGGLRLVQVGA